MTSLKKTLWYGLLYVLLLVSSGRIIHAQTVTTQSESTVGTVEGVVSQPQAYAEIVREYGKARIVNVEETISEIGPSDYAYNADIEGRQERIVQQVTLVHFDGPSEFVNKKDVMENDLEERPKDMRLKAGDVVIISYLRNVETREIEDYVISDYARSGFTWVYIILFAVALCVFGRMKGLMTVLGLVVTFALIFFILVPGIMAGGNPLWLAILTVSIATVVLHIFVAGFSIKALSSILGTIGGTIVAGLLATGASSLSMLTGFASEEAQRLFVLNPNLDFQGIFLAGVIIGAFGAVMDVGVSISSAIQEVKAHAPHAGFHKLFRSGLNVGKDIVGTMSDTLILAYVGTSLPLILILVSANTGNMALNYDFIVDEIVRGIAGSIGLMTAIPITAYFAALLEERSSTKNSV